MTPAPSVIAAVCLLAPTVGGQVDLWGGSRIDAAVKDVSARGVLVELNDKSLGVELRLIGWERVKALPPAADGAADFKALADHAFRARERIRRGDYAAAEPAAESVLRLIDAADPAQSIASPTLAAASEALLACRLRRGAQASAVWPMFAWLAGTEARDAAWIGGSADGLAVIDPRLRLAPGLPPMWLREPSLESLVGDEHWARFQTGQNPSDRLARWYLAAARFECGGDPAPTSTPAADEPSEGVRLVRDIVIARIGDDRQRASSRESLSARLPRSGDAAADSPATPGWIEAWCRAGIGRSLLREPDPDQRRRGVLELLHLPARFRADHPYLAGLALAESAVALNDIGDREEAASLKKALLQSDPSHPAARWARLAEIDAPAPSRSERGIIPNPAPPTGAEKGPA